MKRILLIILVLMLMLSVGGVSVTAITFGPSNPTFENVEELVSWLQPPRAYGDVDFFAQRQGRILVADIPLNGFTKTDIIANNQNSFISYSFENEFEDEIIVYVVLGGFINQEISVSEALAQTFRRNPYRLFRAEPLASVQYATFTEGVQSLSIEIMSLQNTALYYVMNLSGDGLRVYFEIDGTHIMIDFIIRNPDSPLASLRDGWDNSYLDLITFSTRPIGEQPTNGGSELPPLPYCDCAEICVLVDGEKLDFDVDPIIVDNRTLVPIRFIAEALGADVGWDEDTREVTLTIDDESLTFAIGETVAGMDVPAQITNNRTFVPLRFISEFFGADVDWIAESRTVAISTN